jgi:hypothetical protein
MGFLATTLGRYLLGSALVAVVAGYLGYRAYATGYHNCDIEHQADIAAAAQEAADAARKVAAADAEIIRSGSDAREKIRTIYRDREIEVTKNVPPDCTQCSLTPAGIRLLNDAITNAPRSTPPGTGVPPYPVPKSAPGPDWNLSGRPPGNGPSGQLVL